MPILPEPPEERLYVTQSTWAIGLPFREVCPCGDNHIVELLSDGYRGWYCRLEGVIYKIGRVVRQEEIPDGESGRGAGDALADEPAD
jgi:hypothetical protein